MINATDYFKAVNLNIDEINALTNPDSKPAFIKFITLNILNLIIERGTTKGKEAELAWAILALEKMRNDIQYGLEKQRDEFAEKEKEKKDRQKIEDNI